MIAKYFVFSKHCSCAYFGCTDMTDECYIPSQTDLCQQDLHMTEVVQELPRVFLDFQFCDTKQASTVVIYFSNISRDRQSNFKSGENKEAQLKQEYTKKKNPTWKLEENFGTWRFEPVLIPNYPNKDQNKQQ